MMIYIDNLLEALNELVAGLREKLSPKPELQPIPVRSGNGSRPSRN
ncbi:hypothetical protein [Nafulsella turpanensis]|nr:hypothetical protein [Nafulsella turpanensis]